MTPALHDLVFWRGTRWLVTRLLRRGRVEITAINAPLVQWTCLARQLEWSASERAWTCTAYLTPMRGGPSCDD